MDEWKLPVRAAGAGGLVIQATHDCAKSWSENFGTSTTGNFAKDLIVAHIWLSSTNLVMSFSLLASEKEDKGEERDEEAAAGSCCWKFHLLN